MGGVRKKKEVKGECGGDDWGCGNEGGREGKNRKGDEENRGGGDGNVEREGR
jgi:hypothetical protein